jgi:hypothetical protein
MKYQKGFTFIEMILYTALVSVFLFGVIDFGWNVIYGNVKSRNYQEVTQNLRFAEKRILFEIRNASGINSVATQSICLSNSDVTRNPTRIYLSSGVLRIGWGGGSPTCASLTNDMPLIDDLVTVSSLNFVNLSSGSLTKNIQVSLTLSANNPSGRSEWARTQTFVTSAEIRSN